MHSFLVIQTAFLGDVILATPIASELRRLFPEAQIDFLVRKGNESILENHPDINSVFTFQKKEGKFKEIIRLVKQFRKENYSTVINLQRFGSSGFITWLSGGDTKIGFRKNPFSFSYDLKIDHHIGNGQHEVERNLSCIHHLGAENLIRPRIYPTEQNRLTIAKYSSQPYFVLAPASVWFTKQLPESKWIELALQLTKKGKVYLVGAQVDVELCERIRTAASLTSDSNLAGKLSLLESCALFEKATRCFVNDSGPLHMASAVNAPVTAFFCATIPKFGFGPLSDDSIIAETNESLVCRPCGLHGGKSCPEGHFRCGNIAIEPN